MTRRTELDRIIGELKDEKKVVIPQAIRIPFKRIKQWWRRLYEKRYF